METDIRKIENRIRGTGLTVGAFLVSVGVPVSTWASWKAKPSRVPRDRWLTVLDAVERLEAVE